jgi:hypothetical protein
VRLAVLELPPAGALEAVTALRPHLAAVATSVAAERPADNPSVVAERAP